MTNHSSSFSQQEPQLQSLVIKVTSTLSEDHLDFIKEEISKSIDNSGKIIILVCDARPNDEARLIKLVKNSLSSRFDTDGFQEWKESAIQYWKRWNNNQEPSESILKIFSELERTLHGVSLLGEISPRVIARILTFSSKFTTEVVNAYLNANIEGGTYKLDVKKYLRTGAYVAPKAKLPLNYQNSIYGEDFSSFQEGSGSIHHELNQLLSDFDKQLCDHYLAAGYDETYVDYELLEELQQNLNGKKVVLVQGNIGVDNQDNSTMFGLSGADISAAIIAVKLNSDNVDYWTHDHGLFSCQIAGEGPPSEAKILDSLTYDEAQEIAATHPSMLNPGAIKILSENDIILHFNSMLLKFKGENYCTTIGLEIETSSESPIVKCVCLKSGVILMSIDSLNMWRQVGFLASVSETVKKHNMSVDCIATSEANITLTFDTHEISRVYDLEKDLQTLNCIVKIHVPCASISLIGKNVRTLFSKLGGILKIFEKEDIYLISQASSDVNLTFIVNQENSKNMALQIHKILTSKIQTAVENHDSHDDSVQTLNEDRKKELEQKYSHFWWWRTEEKRQKLLKLIENENQPLYVYDFDCLSKNADILNEFIDIGAVDRIYYAMKANNYEEILKIFYNKNLGFECVSLEEIYHILKLFPNISKDRILFTPNFCPKSDYEKGFELGVIVTVDNSFPLLQWGSIFKGKNIWIRVDPGKGLGHHKKVNTGGAQSKFGIPMDELPLVAKTAESLQCKIVGLHTHKGSGILDKTESWFETANHLNNLIKLFPNVKSIDVGGGLGVPHKNTDNPLDLSSLSQFLLSFKKENSDIQIVMEPGRFLVAAAGVLIARVTQTKQKESFVYIGCETGMNSLMRPTLYGAHHEIVNLTRLNESHNYYVADICGPICESGDILGIQRPMPKTESGDVLLIAMGGAYGKSMSSLYNMRKPAKDILLK